MCNTFYFLNGIISVKAVLIAERSRHFCHHCRFFCQASMLWSFNFQGIIYDVSYVVCVLFLKKHSLCLQELLPLELKTLDPSVVRTLHSFCLFQSIKYEPQCIVQTIPKLHMNWEKVSIVRQRVNEWHQSSKQPSFCVSFF